MESYIISNQNHEYDEFILEFINILNQLNVAKIAIQVFTDEGQALTSYYNIDLNDYALIKQQVGFDEMDMYLGANNEEVKND